MHNTDLVNIIFKFLLKKNLAFWKKKLLFGRKNLAYFRSSYIYSIFVDILKIRWLANSNKVKKAKKKKKPSYFSRLFYVRNHLQHTSTHEFYISLSTGVSKRRGNSQYLSSHHGYIKHETSAISAWKFQGERLLENIAIYQRFSSSYCSPITDILYRIRTLHFPYIRALFLFPSVISSLSNYTHT